jgi:hypothetical protein
MSWATDHPLTCARKNCTESVPGSRWHMIHAQGAGWFFQKDGTSWCPRHVPRWVRGWRARRERHATRS